MIQVVFMWNDLRLDQREMSCVPLKGEDVYLKDTRYKVQGRTWEVLGNVMCTLALRRVK